MDSRILVIAKGASDRWNNLPELLFGVRREKEKDPSLGGAIGGCARPVSSPCKQSRKEMMHRFDVTGSGDDFTFQTYS